jgi:hypothetical protein
VTNEIKSPDIRDFIIKTVTAAAVNSGDYGLGPETTSVIADAILKEFPSMEAVTLVGDPELELAILHDPIAWHALTIGRYFGLSHHGTIGWLEEDDRLAWAIADAASHTDGPTSWDEQIAHSILKALRKRAR